MAEGFEFKTVVVRHVQGMGYSPPDAELNELGAAGWELIAVQHSEAFLASEIIEVFYLQRKRTGP